MKLKIFLLLLVLGAIAAFILFGTAEAATSTATVTPSVTVSETLSLAIENEKNVQWGPKPAGSHLTGTIKAQISANTNWTLTVARTSDTYVDCGLLGADGNNHIPTSCFTYTSVAGNPIPSGGKGIAKATQFDTTGTYVWTGGIAISECRVAITYTLKIPANQPPGEYSATHTYTLTSPP